MVEQFTLSAAEALSSSPSTAFLTMLPLEVHPTQPHEYARGIYQTEHTLQWFIFLNTQVLKCAKQELFY